MKQTIVQIINKALVGKTIVLQRANLNHKDNPDKHYGYYLKEEVFAGRRKNEQPEFVAVTGVIKKFVGEFVEYDGDSMHLEVKVDGNIQIVGINSVEDIITTK